MHLPPEGEQIGLSRRELERELNWMLRSLPEEPKALVKLLSQTVLTLIDKNNTRIAQALAAREQPGRHEDS